MSSVDSRAVNNAMTTTPTIIPAVRKAGSSNAVIVNSCQRGNPLLLNIRNVPWEYGDIVPDYQVGATTGVLYLSLRYHRLHPEYIHNRINNMGKMYILRVLLIMVDVDNHHEPIRELTRICITNGLTIISAWSAQEAGRYLETYKSFENKPPDMIKERVDDDYLSKLTDCLTSIRGVNKTDVVTLASTFGSLYNVIHATTEELGDCPGFGETKTKRIREAFDQPFIATSSAAKSAKRQREAARREATRARDEQALRETASTEQGRVETETSTDNSTPHPV